MAGVQDQCLDVAVQSDRAVDLGFDVVVQGISVVGLGQGVGGQAEVSGAEARRCAGGLVPVVEGAVDPPSRSGWKLRVMRRVSSSGGPEERAVTWPKARSGAEGGGTVEW
ncbi:hypothetical protein GCM10009554_05770 [Kribbella koreensis]|uniref:Uncharacterized protein n=1 Tax=Kribbella koreensis TaxID=57909 RepID=A0ABN1PC34_9ACTN